MNLFPTPKKKKERKKPKARAGRGMRVREQQFPQESVGRGPLQVRPGRRRAPTCACGTGARGSPHPYG